MTCASLKRGKGKETNKISTENQVHQAEEAMRQQELLLSTSQKQFRFKRKSFLEFPTKTCGS